uniref:Cytochrome c oxidase subunit 2 n=1 Tax=Jakoba bahamiensis TaxID=221721 RepID=M4Q9N7_9EUKA|nr:cytochrome c oxidase subunit II [Jakoba bahamiensis]AGH24132.1 cytochrome c oxidase subunit 2 [Jakoba bahamiensis]
MILNKLFGLVEVAHADTAQPWQCDFQDAATPMMEGIVNLHHDLFFFLTLIIIFVSWMLFRTIWHFRSSKNPVPSRVVHGTVLEIVWTIVPSFVLIAVAVPSFALLYSMDEGIDPALTIKAIGHQWYWSYEYSDYTNENGESLAFDSYMVPEEELQEGQFRLLEVDNQVVVPAKTHVRVLVTSADVLHSWAIPSLGVKMDACPGRLNQVTMFIKREGTYYGQCSEICGVNHGFMPIAIKAVSLDEYVSWVSNELNQ